MMTPTSARRAPCDARRAPSRWLVVLCFAVFVRLCVLAWGFAFSASFGSFGSSDADFQRPPMSIEDASRAPPLPPSSPWAYYAAPHQLHCSPDGFALTPGAVSRFFASWAHWDGLFYLEIAQFGYHTEKMHAFFPLFPALASQVARAVGFVLVSGGFGAPCARDLLAGSAVLVSNTLAIIAALLMYGLSRYVHRPVDGAAAQTRSDDGEIVSYLGALLFAASPAAPFYSAAYSEALYALAALGGAWLAEKGFGLWASLAQAESVSAEEKREDPPQRLCARLRLFLAERVPTLLRRARLIVTGALTVQAAAVLFACAAAARGNGIALVGYLVYPLVGGAMWAVAEAAAVRVRTKGCCRKEKGSEGLARDEDDVEMGLLLNSTAPGAPGALSGIRPRRPDPRLGTMDAGALPPRLGTLGRRASPYRIRPPPPSSLTEQDGEDGVLTQPPDVSMLAAHTACAPAFPSPTMTPHDGGSGLEEEEEDETKGLRRRLRGCPRLPSRLSTRLSARRASAPQPKPLSSLRSQGACLPPAAAAAASAAISTAPPLLLRLYLLRKATSLAIRSVIIVAAPFFFFQVFGYARHCYPHSWASHHGMEAGGGGVPPYCRGGGALALRVSCALPAHAPTGSALQTSPSTWCDTTSWVLSSFAGATDASEGVSTPLDARAEAGKRAAGVVLSSVFTPPPPAQDGTEKSVVPVVWRWNAQDPRYHSTEAGGARTRHSTEAGAAWAWVPDASLGGPTGVHPYSVTVSTYTVEGTSGPLTPPRTAPRQRRVLVLTLPWPLTAPLHLYRSLQDRYWGVGFFRYWTLKQAPNFVLAAPVLVAAAAAVWTWWRAAWQGLMALAAVASGSSEGEISSGHEKAREERQKNEEEEEEEATDAEAGTLLPAHQAPPLAAITPEPTRLQLPVWVQRYTPYTVHLLFLFLVALTSMHVQVSTRFLSACPALYWFLARWVLSRGYPLGKAVAARGTDGAGAGAVAEAWQLLRLLWGGKAGAVGWWCVGYAAVGTAMFVMFLPWT